MCWKVLDFTAGDEDVEGIGGSTKEISLVLSDRSLDFEFQEGSDWAILLPGLQVLVNYCQGFYFISHFLCVFLTSFHFFSAVIKPDLESIRSQTQLGVMGNSARGNEMAGGGLRK